MADNPVNNREKSVSTYELLSVIGKLQLSVSELKLEVEKLKSKSNLS